MPDEYIDLPGTYQETAEILTALVNTCGCGCSVANNELFDARAVGCWAVRALHDQRFVLGLLYGRRLCAQLVAEEVRGAV